MSWQKFFDWNQFAQRRAKSRRPKKLRFEPLEPRYALAATVIGTLFNDANINGVRDGVGAQQVPSITLGPRGPVVLQNNDDSSTAAVNLGFTLNFYGQNFTQAFINNNGNVTFGRALSSFTPTGFPQTTTRIIAPFWADVDTRGGLGAVHSSTGTSARGNPYFQVDWVNVGYFSQRGDKRNDFSLYIEDDAAGDVVAFVYRTMEWTTGSASGGTNGFGGNGAQIGFDSGNGISYASFARPQQAADLLFLQNTQYAFRLDPQGVPVANQQEPGVGGSLVYLDVNNNGVLDGPDLSSVTLADDTTTPFVNEAGRYQFSNTPIGRFPIRASLPNGYVQTRPYPAPMFVTIVDGTINSNNDIGIALPVQRNVRLSISNTSLAENGGSATLTATLDQVTYAPVTVNLVFGGTASHPADFSRSAAAITIPANTLAGTITIATVNDTTFEGNESLIVDIDSVVSGASVVENGTQTVTATIVDNDATPTVTLAVGAASILENGGAVAVTARLSNPSSQTVTVDLGLTGTAQLGADYTQSANQIAIAPGQTSASILLTLLNDAVFELDKQVIIDITNVTNGLESGTQRATIDLLNDDPRPSVNLSFAANVLNETGSSTTLIALLSNPSYQAIAVDVVFGGGATFSTDYSASGTRFNIPAGQTSAAINLNVLDDATLEGGETIVVDIASVTGGTAGANHSASATIVDNEAPFVSLSISSNSLAENGGSTVVRAVMDRTLSQNVLVNLAFAGTGTVGNDFSTFSPQITLPAGSLTGEISITATDDALPEGPETVIVEIASVTLANELGVQSATASIIDDASDIISFSGSTLTLTGTPGDDVIEIQYVGSGDVFRVVANGYTSSDYTTSMISVDTGLGRDSVSAKLSPDTVDSATLNGSSGLVTASPYTIDLDNVETIVLFGNAQDNVTYQDGGVAGTAYLLPQYGIFQGGGLVNQAIAFGNHTINAVGNNDNLFIYGDSGVQAYVATPTQARMPVGSQLLIGNDFQRVYAYGMGGNDTATYSGSSADEIMTALWNYTFVNTATTVQYFDSFKTLTIAGNGGLDIAVMYDSPGVDTFTSSDTSFRYFRTNVFNNIANDYDKVYAFNYFGGFDTATLNGSSGIDRLYSAVNISVLTTPTTLQQAAGFRTVIVNAGAGSDLATLQDSTGKDTLNTFGSTAELVYGNGCSVRAVGFENVTANGTLGGRNRKNLAGGTFVLKLNGLWL